MVEYRELVEIAIKKQMDTMGDPVALRQARKVPELQIDDEGNVEEMDGPESSIFNELIDKYQDVSGPVACALIATAIKQEAGDNLDVELPEKLQSKM